MKININTLILVGFIIRSGVAIWNGFFGPSFGAGADAVTFHEEAVYLSRDLSQVNFNIGWIYSTFLGVIYYLTAESLFIGSFLSCLAWLLSAIFLKKILTILKINKRNAILIIAFYILIPSSLMYTSVTLREAYQLLFITLAIYSALKIIINTSKNYWILLIFSLIGASVLHGALFAFSVLFLSSIFFMIFIKNKKKISWLKISIISPIPIIILTVGLSLFSETAYQLDDGLSASVESYQRGGLSVEARAQYKTEVAISSIAELVIFIPTSLFQYLFEPMPWRISSIIDIPILIENILRLWFIYLSIKSLRKNKDHHYHRPLLFIFLSYLLIEIIWSLGTINWGTAARHHIPSIGLLLITAFALRNKKINKIKLPCAA